MISFNHPLMLLLILFFFLFLILKKSGLVAIPELKLNLVNWKGFFPKKINLWNLEISYAIFFGIAVLFF